MDILIEAEMKMGYMATVKRAIDRMQKVRTHRARYMVTSIYAGKKTNMPYAPMYFTARCIRILQFSWREACALWLCTQEEALVGHWGGGGGISFALPRHSFLSMMLSCQAYLRNVCYMACQIG